MIEGHGHGEKVKNRFLLIVSAATVLGGLGSIIIGLNLLVGSILIILGVGGALWSSFALEVRNRQAENLIEAQATLLAYRGIGNTYTEAVKRELSRTGSSKVDLLRKALELNPDDTEAIAMLCTTLGLKLSFSQWLGEQNRNVGFDKDLAFTRELAKKGMGLLPQSPIFHDVLGIVFDIEGKHQEARTEFFRSSRLRSDPYWRLLVARSWGMSGNFQKAIEALQEALKEGAEDWVIDLYYGSALQGAGNYEEAQSHLESAFKTRGWRPELLADLATNSYFQGKLLRAAKFEAATGIYLMAAGRFREIRRLVQAVVHFCISLLCTFSKFLWPVTRCLPGLRWVHSRLLPPSEPELRLSWILMRKGHYAAAEQHLRRVCSIMPKRAEIFMSLAVCLAKQGKKEGALLACDTAIELEPENDVYRHNRKTLELWSTGQTGRVIEMDHRGQIKRVIEN